MQKTIANAKLPESVHVPHYERSKLVPRMVHLGLGAFHRGHQGLFMHDLAEQGGDWGICDINLFSGEDLVTQLRQQEHLYTVVEKGLDSCQVKVSGAICRALHPSIDGIECILQAMTDPNIAIVSMTITEKGYCRDGLNHLDMTNPLIQHDLKNPEQPQSAIGYIALALKIRFEKGIVPFSVMSCDNIQENGQVTRNVVLDYIDQLDAQLGQWVREHVSFPSTMVDRIVPAMTKESFSEIAHLLGGIDDPCGVMCEPFRQWVIEDNFVSGRPDWEQVGAQLVDDVTPFEHMKLRMLNGSHSFLAYLGYLGGYDYISQVVANQDYRQAVLALMLQEQAPTLTSLQRHELSQYADSLLERFANPNLKHRTWLIAMDGSQKLPQRMLESVRFHLERGTSFAHLALGIAGWMRYVGGIDEKGLPIEVVDPMASQLKSICDACEHSAKVVPELLKIDAIFPNELASNSLFVDHVTAAYQKLISLGAKRAVAELAKNRSE